MDQLCKHFFEYNSFVNVGLKGIQMHKTPHSQAGCDQTAGWAPKNMTVQGKNLSAPSARPNRNNVDYRPGVHRHGRPSKLHYRQWGERNGELRDEKIVPHKDKWMMELEGDFRHLEGELEEETITACFADFLPNCLKNKVELDIELMLILTLTPRHEFLTVTVKKTRGLEDDEKVQLYEGKKLVDEREHPLEVEEADFEEPPVPFEAPRPLPNGSTSRGRSPSAPPSPQPARNHVQHRVHWRDLGEEHERPLARPPSIVSLPFGGNGEPSAAESFLLRLPPGQLHATFIVVQVITIGRRRRPAPTPEEGPSADTSERAEVIGSCCIGAGKVPQGVRHWRQTIERVGHPTFGWHRLFGCRTMPPTAL
ncbi:C2 domain-containing protein [Aphelenchoides fujianensis]|nr:C2 domain-containing protein [Aphelenchoides fujianensis]